MPRIIPQMTPLVEAELEALLKGKVDVSIGGIEGGIFRHYQLKNVQLRDVSGTFPVVKIEHIALNRGLFGMITTTTKGLQSLFRTLSHPFVDLSIQGEEGWFNGVIRIEEMDARSVRFQGFKRPFKKENILFRGVISPSPDLTHGVFTVEASPFNGSLKMKGEISGSDISLTANGDHLFLAGADIVTEAVLTGSFKNNAQGRFSGFDGRLITTNLILNQKPFRDLDVQFQFSLPSTGSRYRLEQSVLDIQHLKLGKDVKARGRVFLESPDYPVDITVLFDNLNITQLLLDLKVKMPELSNLSGIANAKFLLKGPLAKIRSAGTLEIKKGNLGELNFETLNVSVKGEGPLIMITDSRINKKEGYMEMRGELDLRNLNNDLFRDVDFIIDNRAIEWEGWNIVKENTGNLRIKATKPVSDRLNIGFKTFVNDETDTLRDRRSSLELEYKLYKRDSLKMRMGAEQEYFGLEHTERF